MFHESFLKSEEKKTVTLKNVFCQLQKCTPIVKNQPLPLKVLRFINQNESVPARVSWFMIGHTHKQAEKLTTLFTKISEDKDVIKKTSARAVFWTYYAKAVKWT